MWKNFVPTERWAGGEGSENILILILVITSKLMKTPLSLLINIFSVLPIDKQKIAKRKTNRPIENLSLFKPIGHHFVLNKFHG